MVMVDYLYMQKRNLNMAPFNSHEGSYVLDALAKDIGLSVADVSLAQIMKIAGTLTWTRDPFDRMIVAHAMVANAALVSKDRLIRKHCDRAIW